MYIMYSAAVDRMLMQAANVEMCPEPEKYICLLLLDEMHICL